MNAPAFFRPARPAPDRTSPPACSRCGGSGLVFECEHLPACDCPGGTTRPGCPGETVPCPACTPQSGDLFHHPV